MKTYDLRRMRFYSGGDDGGGAGGGQPQGGNGNSQGDDPDKNKTAGTDPGPGDADKDKKDDNQDEPRLSRENAKWRNQVRTLEAQIAELSEKLEAADNAKLTETERLQKEREKLQKQAETAALEAKQAKKMLLATKATAKHSLPEDFAERLLGDTEEELEEDAKSIAALIDRLAREKYRTPAPDTEGGNRRQAGNGLTDEQRQRDLQQTAKHF